VIAVPPGVRILLAAEPVDFRKGMDGLAALVQQALRADPFAGDVFVFRSRRMDRVKIGAGHQAQARQAADVRARQARSAARPAHPGHLTGHRPAPKLRQSQHCAPIGLYMPLLLQASER